MSTVIQYTKEYPTVELTYGADFQTGLISVKLKSSGAVVDLSGYDFLWQFRAEKNQDSALVASLTKAGGTAGTVLTVNGPAGTISAFIPFSLILASGLASNTKIWHDLRVRNSQNQIEYWWRGVILLVTGVTSPGGA